MYELPPIIFGNMANRQTNDLSRVDLFQYVASIGISTFDKAPVHDFGRAERQLGQAFGNSDAVTIISKVGLRWDKEARGATFFLSSRMTRVHDARYARIRARIQCGRMLKRA